MMSAGKILVVDDDQNICELLRLYIEKEGFEVRIANDGRKALEIFEEQNPDLIMLDIMLPELDGWQVCREIRKKSQCPIIMLTAKGEVFDKVLGLELGADDYVAGKAVKLENVTDKQGFHATMYIKFNPEKGRPYRYDTNPDNAQQVAPSNESRTQVAVNNDGKTNEATKNLREPLQKGQTNPKDARQQQQQEKPQKKTGKGMKM